MLNLAQGLKLMTTKGGNVGEGPVFRGGRPAGTMASQGMKKYESPGERLGRGSDLICKYYV